MFSGSLSKDSIFIYFNLCISFFKDIRFIYAFLLSNSFFFYASPVISPIPVPRIIFCIKLIPTSLQCGVRNRGEGRLLGLRKG